MIVKQLGTWRDVADAARTTVRLPEGTGEPSDNWKRMMLRSEHSPIRLLTFKWKWEGIPSWVSVHFVRHKVGIEHFVSSQRTDRTGIDRNAMRQDTPVNHECVANAQALITISRKRLCSKASPETKKAWNEFLAWVPDDHVREACVPECVYRGFCPEQKSCGYASTGEGFQLLLERYRK